MYLNVLCKYDFRPDIADAILLFLSAQSPLLGYTVVSIQNLT